MPNYLDVSLRTSEGVASADYTVNYADGQWHLLQSVYQVPLAVAGAVPAAARLTVGGYGYRLNHSIALAYVRTDLAREHSELEVEILGERCRAVVAREPLYDPHNRRLRA